MQHVDVIQLTLARLCALETLQTSVPPELKSDDRRRLAKTFQFVSPVSMQLSPVACEIKQKKTVRFRLPEAEFEIIDAEKDSFRPGKMASQLPLDSHDMIVAVRLSEGFLELKTIGQIE